MVYICPVCSKNVYNYQNCIQCDSCNKWVHHGNRLQCSGLTEEEFIEHQIEEFKLFECDHCVSEHIAKENNSVFISLPFPVECEDNIFGKPKPTQKPDISSMNPVQLKKFVQQCEQIENQLNPDTDETDNSSHLWSILNITI